MHTVNCRVVGKFEQNVEQYDDNAMNVIGNETRFTVQIESDRYTQDPTEPHMYHSLNLTEEEFSKVKVGDEVTVTFSI